MTAPLDEKALEAAHVAYERYGQAGDLKTQRLSSGCIEAIVLAYLAASPSPSMEMEVVAWRYHSGAKGAKWTVQKNHPVEVARWNGYTVEPLVTLSQAQSALAAMREKLAIAERNRDAGRENFHTMQQAAHKLAQKLEAAEARANVAEEAENEAKDCFWAIYPRYLELGGEPVSTEAARTDLSAQVLRLTEANEALRKERETMAREWCEFCAAIGVDVDTHDAVADEIWRERGNG